MKPSREEVLKIAIDCGLIVDEDYNHIWFDLVQRFAAAIYEAGAKSERAVSDRLLEALKGSRSAFEAANAWLDGGGAIEDTIWYSATETLFDYMDSAIAEVEAMRKEKPE